MERRDKRLQVLRTCTLMAAVIVVTLANVGCGGSSVVKPVGSHPAPTLSAPSQMLAKADAICKQLNSELGPTVKVHVGTSEIARTAAQHAALEMIALTGLSKLMPPASLARDWSKIIAYRRTLAEQLVKLGRYAQANNLSALRALGVSKERLHRDLFDTATRDGFKECSKIGPGGAARSTPPSPSRPHHLPV